MRVVIDSNVIVAAFAARGICTALFEYCVENLEVVICEEMLREIEKALLRKIRAPRAVAREVLEYLRESTETVSAAPIDPRTCRDESDLAVIGAAVAAGCDYIVTGDADLLSLGKHEHVKIVSPRAFWDTMRKNRGPTS
jgi:putative PIN family toxin of toxin-antitoxin system